MGGDPAHHVLGKPEEKPARRHSRQKPKPRKDPLKFEERLLRDIRQRKAEIAPFVQEIPELEKAQEILNGLKK